MGNPVIPPQPEWTPPKIASHPERGINAHLAAEYIGAGMRQLPTPGPAEKEPIRSVIVEVPQFGKVKITYKLSSYKHGRSRFWHWTLGRADVVEEPKPVP